MGWTGTQWESKNVGSHMCRVPWYHSSPALCRGQVCSELPKRRQEPSNTVVDPSHMKPLCFSCVSADISIHILLNQITFLTLFLSSVTLCGQRQACSQW